MLFCFPRRFNFRFYGLLTFFVVLSLWLYWVFWHSYDKIESISGKSRHLSKLITVVFRLEDYENDVANSVQSIVSVFPNMAVVVVCKTALYPPLPFSTTNETLRNVMVISPSFRLNASPRELDPLTYISTEYVLFMPDTTRVSRRVLQQAMTQAVKNPDKPVAIGVGSAPPVCHHISLWIVDWTLRYKKEANNELCDSVKGQHCLLVKTSLLRLLPDPFRLPFPETLYLQTAVRKIKVNYSFKINLIKSYCKNKKNLVLLIQVQLATGRMAAGRSVFKTLVTKQRAITLQSEQKIALYDQLGVKVVIDADNHVEWFGCTKATQVEIKTF